MNMEARTIGLTGFVTSGLLLGLAGGISSAASDTAPASKPADDQASARFDFKTVLADSAEWHAELSQTREKLAAQLERTDEGLDRAQAHLAMANWFIAVPTARPATRWVLGLATKADPVAIAASTAAATKHLEQAQAILDKASKADKAEAKERRRDLSQSAEIVSAFVDLFKAVEVKPGDAAQEAWRKAARGLAVARESQDSEVAAAAQLWQAFALVQAGKRDRALEVLPDALAKPEHLPYDLMSRLLRMRLAADAGEYAAAVSLLSRMEANLKNWMGNQNQERNNARRLVELLQHRVLEAWMERLRTTTHPEAAADLAAIAARIERSFTEVKAPNIYYMATTVPLQVRMPAAPKAKEPATAPETRPTPATSTAASD